MRKYLTLSILFCFMATSPSFASELSQNSQKTLSKSGTVISRGVLNVLGSPAEFYTTVKREKEMHSKLWPVSVAPRAIGNVITRVSAGVVDVFFNPFIVPFTDDLTPITEPMGLPDYPWEVE